MLIRTNILEQEDAVSSVEALDGSLYTTVLNDVQIKQELILVVLKEWVGVSVSIHWRESSPRDRVAN
jgi:hypothetical protein